MIKKTITISVPHDLPQAEVKSRLQTKVADLRHQHASKIAQVEEHWDGDRLDFRVAAMGQTLTGRIDVQPKMLVIQVDLPWLLAMLAQRLEPQVTQEARKMLESKSS
ncbi:MAG: polyhydroxyalkanoic acid system family protein [Tepidisphaeraceae bacterium]